MEIEAKMKNAVPGAPVMNSVLFVSGIGGDTRRYRCAHQQEQLMLKNVITALREDDDTQLLMDVFDYDLFILHRVPYSPLIGLFIELAHAQGKPVVFETDDFVFAPELETRIRFIDALTPEAARRFRSDLTQLEKAFRCCDCVLTATEFLAQEAQRRGKPAYVHRNAPNADMFHLSEQAWAERQRQLNQESATRPVVIAYFSGTRSHNQDFQIAVGPLVWLLSTFPHVCVHIGGYLEPVPAFKPFWSRIRYTPHVTWRELPQFIAQADINLAPLEQDNPFCQAKSEIKFVEAALVGVPTIASRVNAYEQAITHGQDGFLADTSNEWCDALQTLVADPDRRLAMGEAARRSVYARYTPERRAEELWNNLNDIWRRFSTPPVNDDKLRYMLVAGFRQYAGEMQRQAQQQETQIENLHESLRHYESQLFAVEQRNLSLEQRNLSLEEHLAALRQGRVMRMMTAVHYWRQKIMGKRNS